MRMTMAGLITNKEQQQQHQQDGEEVIYMDGSSSFNSNSNSLNLKFAETFETENSNESVVGNDGVSSRNNNNNGDMVEEKEFEEKEVSTSTSTFRSSTSTSTWLGKRMLLVAGGLGMIMILVGSLSTGLVLMLQDNDDNDVCIEGQVQDIQDVNLELTLGGISEPLSKENQQLLEIAVKQAYNDISLGCDDSMGRFMISTTFTKQELSWNSYLNSSAMIATLHMKLSCDDCTPSNSFADEYPFYFYSNVYDYDTDTDTNTNMNTNHQRKLSSSSSSISISSSTASATKSASTTSTTPKYYSKSMDTTSTVRGSVKKEEEESVRKVTTRQLQEQLDSLLNAGEIMNAIEQVATDLGLAEDDEFQGMLEAVVVTRTQKLVLINGGKKGNKKFGKKGKKGGKNNSGDEGGGGGGGKKQKGKQKKGGESSSFSNIIDIIQEIAELVLNPFVLPDTFGICQTGYIPTYGNCGDGSTEAIFEEIRDYLEYSNCFRSPPADTNVIFTIIANCAVIYEKVPEIQTIPNFFNPQSFPDGTYDKNDLETKLNNAAGSGSSSEPMTLYPNQYAWAGDYNSDCGLGVMIHSGGTGSLLDEFLSAPTITIRNEIGETVYHDYVYGFLGEQTGFPNEYFPKLGVGIRSGLIVACEPTPEGIGSLVTMVLAKFSRQGDLRRITIDTTKEGPESIVDYAVTDIPSPSVRSMTQMGCLISYAPLNDIQDLEELTVGNVDEPFFITYNWCGDTPGLTGSTFGGGGGGIGSSNMVGTLAPGLLDEYGVDEKTKDLQGYFVWDFKCNEFDICWVNLCVGSKDKTKASGLDVTPELFWFPSSFLNQESDLTDVDGDDIPLTQVQLELSVDTGALSLETIDADRVLACSLSGWIYQVVAAGLDLGGRDAGTRRGRRNLQQGPLAEPLGLDLLSLELGTPQQCNICSASKQTCTPALLPELTPATAYNWQAKKCGNYMFVGTLDISGIVGPLILNEIQDALGFFNFEFPPAQREWFISIVSSLVFGSVITPYDKGFDIWFIELDELATAEEPSFRPITLSGFKKEATDEDYGALWPQAYPFGPNTVTEDGVRQLVCHDDKFLMVGTATFNGGQSSSTWVLNLNENVPGVMVEPERPPIGSINPNIEIPEAGLGQILNDRAAMIDFVGAFALIFSAIANTGEDADDSGISELLDWLPIGDRVPLGPITFDGSQVDLAEGIFGAAPDLTEGVFGGIVP